MKECRWPDCCEYAEVICGECPFDVEPDDYEVDQFSLFDADEFALEEGE